MSDQKSAAAKALAAARRAEVIRLYGEGKTTTEIMGLVGVKRDFVCDTLKDIRPGRATDEQIILAHQEGRNVAAIARLLRADPQRIRRVLGIDAAPAEHARVATRRCPECAVKIPVGRWALHLTEVHGYTGKVGKAQSSVERYIANLPPAGEPQRPPDPPCAVCGASPCPTPITHGRTARTWAQRGYQPRKKAA